ncbi:hypothetical protein BGK67_00235 [Streptomyces subrutilus]|uniref:Uncharacterized protein n=1 Tax=Streptomyces subrutilus TaxID=36818 RepID=A0A1E5PKP5_9ACTN|nr:hypothetical protein BGK67_00235 [Streptomyces subrutilus]
MEQGWQELLQQHPGRGRVLEFVVAEPEDLVAPEFQVAVGGHRLRVLGAVGALTSVAGVVLGPVDFEHDALPVREQEKEVHAGAQQGLGAPFADGLMALVCLGGYVEFSDVHPDQVAALGRRRDLPVLLDRHMP